MKENIVKILCLVIGITCLIITIILTANSLNFFNNGIHTKGIITDYRIVVKEKTEKGHRVKTKTYYAIFKFKDFQNTTVTVESDVGTSSSLCYDRGTQVEILYIKNNSREAIINSFSNLWLAPMILAIIAIVSLAIGYNIPRY